MWFKKKCKLAQGFGPFWPQKYAILLVTHQEASQGVNCSRLSKNLLSDKSLTKFGLCPTVGDWVCQIKKSLSSPLTVTLRAVDSIQ